MMLSLLHASAALAPMHAPLRGAYSPLRPVAAAPVLRRAPFALMQEAEAAAAPPAEELCIETGEEVEECTLLSWEAGKISAPQALVDKAKLGAPPPPKTRAVRGSI